MGLYVNGQTDHEGTLHSFCVQNYTTGSVVNHHAGWEFVFGNSQLSAGIEFEFRKRRYDLSRIAGLVYNAREDHHEFYHRPNANLAAIVISEEFINGYLGDLETAANFCFRDPLLANGRAYHLVQSAHSLLRSGCLSKTESMAIAEAIVFEAIDAISHDRVRIKEALAAEWSSKFLFKEIVGEIHKGFCQRDFDLDQLSSEIGVSKFHIIRTTKRMGGFTPYAYLLKLRLFRARTLLLESQQPISDIAFNCGFDDLSTFNKAFKRLFRKTPSSFRSHNT